MQFQKWPWAAQAGTSEIDQKRGKTADFGGFSAEPHFIGKEYRPVFSENRPKTLSEATASFGSDHRKRSEATPKTGDDLRKRSKRPAKISSGLRKRSKATAEIGNDHRKRSEDTAEIGYDLRKRSPATGEISGG